MTVLTLGDLSLSYSQKLHSARLKSSLSTMTAELASGRQSDLRKATSGSFNVLASLEHQMGALKAYKTSANEAASYTNALQSALGTVQGSVEDITPALLQAADSGYAPTLTATANDARARFSTVVSAFNVNVADRSLMSGTASGNAALADADTILADLMTAIAAETTAAGVETVVEAWFDDVGGGFETSGYLGSMTGRAPFRVGLSETVTVDVTAADQRVRDVLKGYAMAAVVAEGALPTNEAEQATLMRSAGERLFAANTNFTGMRGEIGAAQAAIDTALARNASEDAVLEIARNDIVGADPYELAVDLEAAQLQLEALYAVTARLSRLSLTEYLR